MGILLTLIVALVIARFLAGSLTIRVSLGVAVLLSLVAAVRFTSGEAQLIAVVLAYGIGTESRPTRNQDDHDNHNGNFASAHSLPPLSWLMDTIYVADSGLVKTVFVSWAAGCTIWGQH